MIRIFEQSITFLAVYAALGCVAAAQIPIYEFPFSLARSGASAFAVPDGSSFLDSQVSFANHRMAAFSYATSSGQPNTSVFLGDDQSFSANVDAGSEIFGLPEVGPLIRDHSGVYFTTMGGRQFI